ncbi:MAG: HIT domain-containing protein [Gammaproteobacteria bacterium]|nr:HIT domain-containing protein [Gammaproteobacteria bacterium]MCP5136773.1 HIT domain-containing protein [Gammaproteobacteria bacterium]
MSFHLHPRLAVDTSLIGDLELCRVLLMNDARYPWLILVPRRDDLREVHELSGADRLALMNESCHVAETLQGLFMPDKLNIGVLGNIVPQLHVHHIARFQTDPAWPGPVWGHSSAQPYPSEMRDRRVAQLRGAFGL